MASEADFRRVTDIADRRARAMVTAYAESVAGATTDERLRRALVRALANGRLDEAFRLADDALSVGAQRFRSVATQAFRAALEEAGFAALSALPDRVTRSFAFDLTNPRAVEFVRDNVEFLVESVTIKSRAAIRTTIERAFVEGVNHREAARMIRGSIGLTAPQASSLARIRRDLLSRGLPLTRRAELIEAAKRRMIRHRATTIARTEILRASNAGQQELWRQAADAGMFPAGAKRRWIVAFDDRLCPICRPMSGQLRGLEQDFRSSFNGATARVPPIHPRCRCAVGLDVKTITRPRRVAA